MLLPKNFNRTSVAPRGVNIDGLFDKRAHDDAKQYNHYNAVLDKINRRIEFEAKKQPANKMCWVSVPPFVLGTNKKYDQEACSQFVISKLKENGFDVKYFGLGQIAVSWMKHVAPHIRQEYTKRTGIKLDSYGRPVQQMDENAKKNISLRERLTQNIVDVTSFHNREDEMYSDRPRPNELMVMQPVVDKYGNYMEGNSEINQTPKIITVSSMNGAADQTKVHDAFQGNDNGNYKKKYTPIESYVPGGNYGVYDQSVLNF